MHIRENGRMKSVPPAPKVRWLLPSQMGIKLLNKTFDISFTDMAGKIQLGYCYLVHFYSTLSPRNAEGHLSSSPLLQLCNIDWGRMTGLWSPTQCALWLSGMSYLGLPGLCPVLKPRLYTGSENACWPTTLSPAGASQIPPGKDFDTQEAWAGESSPLVPCAQNLVIRFVILLYVIIPVFTLVPNS